MARNRIDHVPNDIAIEILSKLPADSLVRFKCVQKSWYDQIESEKFLKLQLRNHVNSTNSDNDSNVCLLAKSARYVSLETENILSLLTYDRNTASFTPKNVDPSFCKDYYDLRATANADGIVCLYGLHFNYIAIANLGIRKFWRLPQSPIGADPTDDSESDYSESDIYHNIRVGAGFDPKTNDYKIVRIYEVCWHSLTPIGKGAEIYTMSSNSWRNIDLPKKRIDIDCMSRVGSYWNGAYYWIANAYRVHGVLSFDMSDEEFHFSQLNISFDHSICVEILEYKGNLALISYPWEKEEKCFDILALGNFWVDGTVTKLFSVGPILDIERPLVFLNNSKILLVAESNGQVVSYNITTHKMERLPVYCRERSDEQVMVYKRSLVFSVANNALLQA